jgi:hypothetical protein
VVQGETGSASERGFEKKILDEAHTLRYSIHPGNTKMYHDLR